MTSMFHYLSTREASLVWHLQRLTACLALPGILLMHPILLALASLPLCVHIWIGIGEILEDYVHGEGPKAVSLFCLRCVMLKVAKLVLLLCIL